MLLKNEDRLLPLEPRGKVALIGAFAESPRFQGSGSSKARAPVSHMRSHPRTHQSPTPPIPFTHSPTTYATKPNHFPLTLHTTTRLTRLTAHRSHGRLRSSPPRSR